MTSQISMRNLLKQEIKQTSWMFALSFLAQFMAGPVLFLLSVTWGTTPEVTVSRFASFFSDSYFLLQLFMIILAICFTIFSYRYLYSKRMTDLYHSVPITRGKLFLVKYLHGVLVWFIPFAVFSILTLLLAFFRLNVLLTPAYAGILALSFLKAFVLLVLCFFIFYHLYLVASYLSGNVLNMFTNVAIIGFIVISIYYLCYALANLCFNTFCLEPSIKLLDVLFAFSPFTAPFAIFYFYETSGFKLLFSEHYILLLLCIVLSALMFFAAKRLYEKRPSELAERGTLNKSYLVPARLAISFLASIALALFFGELGSSSMELAWGIFGCILGGILCYGTIDSIFSTTIKSFFKHKVQMAGVTVAGLLVFLTFQLDLVGYDTYLPDKNDIRGMAIYQSSLTDSSYNVVTSGPDSFSYLDTYSHHIYQEDALTDTDVCYDLLSLAVDTTNFDRNYPNETNFTFYAKIELNGGRTYYRKYRLYDFDYELLAPFVETDSYKNTYYKISSGLLGYPQGVDVYFDHAGVSLELPSARITGLMDAYFADFNEHYHIEELTSFLSSINLNLHYEEERYGHYFNLEIPSTYRRTLGYLEALYPEYISYVDSADELSSLTPSIYRSSINEYGGIYGYFGYEGLDAPQSTDTTGAENTEKAETVVADGPSVTVVEVADQKTYAVPYERTNNIIKDQEFLEKLYPYLYFGYYRDSFDQREYIYLGDVISTKSEYSNCYVKPGTLPLEIIEILDGMVTEDLKY